MAVLLHATHRDHSVAFLVFSGTKPFWDSSTVSALVKANQFPECFSTNEGVELSLGISGRFKDNCFLFFSGNFCIELFYIAATVLGMKPPNVHVQGTLAF